MDITTLLAENIVQGFIIGLLVGFVVRVASKAVRNLLILQFIGLKYLESRNIIIIDWHRLSNGLIGQQELAIGKAQEMIDTVVEMGIFGVALAAGFLLVQRIGK
ncbi:MAG: FUN14 domain-containing protein [Candidatus Poseidoniaceae archaeon]|tara:strand:- start:34 stop:345 length:312 start_codon:yes stop_codon:yes gene_type:complete